MHLVSRASLLSLLLLCASVVPASAALRIAVGTSGAKLAVSADGRALVTWTQGDAHRTAVVTGSSVRYAGTVSYHGKPVFGSAHSSTGNPLDALGRNVYLDSHRPTGWYRLLGVLARPLGYALSIKSDLAGSQYRATIVGPNVGGDLAPVASAVTPASPTGTCPFPPGTYKVE